MDERQLLAALAKNPALLAMLASGLAASTKAAATTPLAISPTGPGGLTGVYGLEADLMNAMVSPMAGLEGRLPVRTSKFSNPKYGILTGLTASSGSEPTAACATPKRAGNLKLCWQTWDWGRLSMETQVIRIDNAGMLMDRSEFLDYRVVGNPWADVPTPANVTPERALKNKYAKAMLELHMALQRDYKHLTYDGNPANTAGSAGYIEWRGLDQLIRTGYRDGGSGVLCPAADSAVLSFGDLVVQTNGAAMVRTLTELYRVRMKYLAAQLGLDVKFAFVMRFGAFRALTEIWPCVYDTFRCTTALPGAGTATVVIDGREQERMRQDMRTRNFLLIDGEEVEVIIDDSIAESIGAAGNAESAIYIVPLTINGEAALFYDYFDFKGPEGAQSIIEMIGPAAPYMVSPDGRYLYHILPPTYWCNQIAVVTWKRLVLRAPFLAAKITDVRYTYIQHEREFDPDDPYYFVNGGQTGQPVPYFYPPFSS